MEPRIEILPEKKLVGKRLSMSLSANRTFELFRSFMPERKRIRHTVSGDIFCVQVYDDALDFKDFGMDTVFDKWAAVEVSEFDEVPDGMETHTLKGGLYAVFLYKGRSTDFAATFNYIYKEWLPQSGYELDQREHFDVMGDKYKNDDPESEEDVWVPIRKK